MILQFKIVAGSDWQLVSTDVLTLLSPCDVSSLYHCKMERLILMISLLHRWTGKVLCHSEIIETAISTDLTLGQCERNTYSIKA